MQAQIADRVYLSGDRVIVFLMRFELNLAMILCKLATLILAMDCWTGNPDAAINPVSAGTYRASGLSYREQLRYPEAIAAFQKAAELDPTNPSNSVLLGWTQHLAGQEDAATQTLLNAAYQDLSNVSTFNALGIVLLTRGKLDDAVWVHSWALGLNSDNEIAYYNLSLAYHRLQQYDWAIATAKKAARLEPSNPHPFVALAIAHWSKGDRSSATQAYRQALQIDSRYRDRSFLGYLNEAGFHIDQIRVAEQVLLRRM
ncbi:tetratricopeptide repeat protein [Altericista sp. CCNU0014]|uniref:tetratricopeptide repeat protein n=1 Tax=Altericista sp. CCNU0014 TaxID=3082949 RepID=UPI00384E194F